MLKMTADLRLKASNKDNVIDLFSNVKNYTVKYFGEFMNKLINIFQ